MKSLKKISASIFISLFLFSAGAQELQFWNKDAVLGASARTSASASGSCYYDCMDLFLDVFTDICCSVLEVLWLDNHLNMEFDEYPYANGSKYIIYDGFLSDSESEGITISSGGKFYRFTFETGAFYFPRQSIIGNESRLEGYIYKFFGPAFENIVFTDSKTLEVNKNLTGNVRIGGTFNFANFNIINVAANFQWTHWYGLEKHNGINFGVILRSYPFSPILIEWRGNWQIFDPNEEFVSEPYILESHLELGLMTGRCEIYTAWKYIYDNCRILESHGIAAGLKLHI